MFMQRKTIIITDQMENWVKAQVDSGKFLDDSEYFRDLLRQDQERQEAKTQLCFMLDEAESSGISDRTPQEIWEEVETGFAKQSGYYGLSDHLRHNDCGLQKLGVPSLRTDFHWYRRSSSSIPKSISRLVEKSSSGKQQFWVLLLWFCDTLDCCGLRRHLSGLSTPSLFP